MIYRSLWHAGYDVCYWALNNVVLRNNGNLAWCKQSRNNSVAPNNGAYWLDESKNRLSVCSIVGRPLMLAGTLNFHRLLYHIIIIYVQPPDIDSLCKDRFTTFPAKIVRVFHSFTVLYDTKFPTQCLPVFLLNKFLRYICTVRNKFFNSF